ncbi:MAG: sialate O-acetylesterase, partial [Verrucomicrobiota bacterium]|nr:sialate O-acetylesterase [Verrucomicrobiota bacterium]
HDLPPEKRPSQLTCALTYTLDGNNDINGGELLYITENWDIEYTACPVDQQLYPRDRNTDTASVEISGTVTNSVADAIVVRVYRDEVLNTASTQSLVFANGMAPFAFSPVIVAETNNYDFGVFILEGERETLVKRVLDVVAGDVFIIQGQSNADAREYTGSASENQHPFLRTFGMNSDNSTITTANQRWLVATGDGSREVVAGVGQWGLRMGRLLVDAYHFPVAILNGAHGGRPVDFFQRNDAAPEDLETNYGRLLYRTRLAGVTNGVRSILWYQGESDNGDGEVHETGFIALYNDWKENYPELERIYIHQLRVGCSVVKEDVDLRDRQRRLPDTFPDMSVMSTTGIDGHDGCHYAYENGYKLIGNHIAALVAVDLYGSANTANTIAPNIDYAYFNTPTSDEITVVVRHPSDPLGFDAAASADFLLEGSSATVTGGVISSNNTIILTLSGDASDAVGLTYTGHEGSGAWVTNAGGVGLLTFFDVSIAPLGDQDGDGLSDTWEERYFGNATQALPDADADGDGQDNGQEYITGLDPTNPASFFAINHTPDYELDWISASGRIYSVYWSSNLFSGFQCLESNVLWTSTPFIDSTHDDEKQGFYKVDVQMQ